MSYSITINSVDRTSCILTNTIKITDETNDKPSSMSCSFFDHDNLGDIELDQEIIVTKDAVRLFAGSILSTELKRLGAGEMIFKIDCVDYTRILDRNLVVEGYEGMTDKEIIEDIVANYCQGSGITTTNVIEGVTINKIIFNYLQPSQCFRKICELTGRSWYLDYNKDIHYFQMETTSAPFDIDSASATYSEMSLTKDNSDIRNRVYIRGGTYFSDFTTISQVADGEQTVFWLPNKPHEFTMKENTVAQTVGIKNIDDPLDFDYLMNFQEKYVERADGVAPTAGTVMEYTYKYDIPVLVAVENPDSIEEIGQFEHAIFDNSILNLNDARARAQAELADYADTIVDGTFETLTDGFRAGQFMNINLSDYSVNANYLVQKVVARALGNGSYNYTVYIASTKKLGIITFLIKLLENDKNFLNIDPNEVVDELFSPDSQGIIISDSMISDSLIEPPFQWGSCKWGLAQWS